MTRTHSAGRRARRWFWALLLVAVGAMGGLYSALRAAPGPGAGLAVATTSVILLLSTAQAARILLAVERARRRNAELEAGDRDVEPVPSTVWSARDRILGPPADRLARPRRAAHGRAVRPR